MKKTFFAWVLLGGMALGAPLALASRIEKMDIDKDGNFDLGPTQFSIDVAPGQTVTKTLQLTSGKPEQWEYQMSVEDFQGSADDPEQTVLLQGEASGKYSAKDWVTLEHKSYQLNPGERLHFDVTIKVPENADPGDHYASVLAKADPKPTSGQTTDASAPAVNITSRVGALFFIKVKGPQKEEGQLDKFEMVNEKIQKLPAEFKSTFRNDGTVRLTPYGKIEIKNMAGMVINEIEIKPYNVLRNSVRAITHRWEGDKFLLGKYTATLKLNRGYGDNVDTASVSFWIIPWKTLAIAAGIIIAVLALLAFLAKKLDIQIGFKGKKKKRRK